MKVLQNLEIMNGTISPKYDVYNNVYSVSVDENVNYLVINYKLEEGCNIEIIGNENFKSGENKVYLELKKEEEKELVTLLVNKEKAEVVSSFDLDVMRPIDIVEPLPSYVAPLLADVCFLIILFTFVILFHRKKKR